MAAKIVAERTWHGPHAKCMSSCDFSAWRGDLSWLLADDVRRLARQHVRETGHQVEIETTSTTVLSLDPEAERLAPEDRKD